MSEIPSYFIFGYVMIIGACLGSFANVVIFRMPEGLSVVLPGSYCWSCKKPIRLWNNIPILSWFILRGRCANCRQPYSFRYPAVEILMSVLFGGAYYRLGLTWTLLEILVFIFGLVVVSFIDFDHMILPDKFTLSGIIVGLLGAWLSPDRPFMDALYGVLLGGGFLWAIAYFYALIRKREGMGGGDIKLLAWIGAVLGWQAVPFVILISSLLGSFFGVLMVFWGTWRESSKGVAEPKENMGAFAIPFGPFLAMAALIYVLCNGQAVIQWYIDLHHL